MGKTLLEKMQQSKDRYGIAYVSYCNNGKVRVDQNYMADNMAFVNSSIPTERIGDAFANAINRYSGLYPFDFASMDLELGLMFPGTDLDQNQKLKAIAKPIDGIVRFDTGKIDAFFEGEKTNELDYGDYYAKNGYIKYDKMISFLKENQLEFNGPETFEEFEEAILSGEIFDVTVTAKFQEKAKQHVKKR